MRDIANVLGIKQASLYYYFSSKETALELVCLKGVEGFFDAAKAIAARPESSTKRLTLLIKSHLSPLVDRPDFVRVFLNERQHLPRESRRRIGRWSRGLERIFEDVIMEGIKKGEFRADLDARLATLAILGMCNAASNWHRKESTDITRAAPNSPNWRSVGWASARQCCAVAAERAIAYSRTSYRIRLSYRI
jgi:AcrR family transcriptional regulator